MKGRRRNREILQAFDRAALETPCGKCGRKTKPVWSEIRYVTEERYYALSFQPCAGCEHMVMQAIGDPETLALLRSELVHLGPFIEDPSSRPSDEKLAAAHFDIASAVASAVGRPGGTA